MLISLAEQHLVLLKTVVGEEMNKKLIINSFPLKRRICSFMEDSRVKELYVERHNSKDFIGNIYKAKVSRSFTRYTSCFVNIGTDRFCFFYRDDVVEPGRKSNRKDPREAPKQYTNSKYSKDGQEILVQGG